MRIAWTSWRTSLECLHHTLVRTVDQHLQIDCRFGPIFSCTSLKFWVSDGDIVEILIIKPTRCANFSKFFWNKTLHASDSSSVHHQEFFTVHTATVYAIQGWQLASRITTELVPSWSCSQAVSKPAWHIPLLFVQWNTPDDGQRNCPKHVEFYFKKILRN